MKGSKIFILMITLAIVVVWGQSGTYRIYTGLGVWKVERIAPDPEGPRTAAVVPPITAIWDQANQHLQALPWGLLYNRDDAKWLSWTEDGRDPDHLEYGFYRYISPSFKIYEEVSRATLWFACDDSLDSIVVRRLGYPYGTFTVPINQGLFYDLYRVDLTDLFASIADGGLYEIDFFVRNTCPSYTGLIAYLSYDFSKYPETYIYKHPLSDRSFWYTISLPFRPVHNSSTTLKDLFPWADSARTFNFETGALVYVSLTSPLNSALGDTVRTFTIQLLENNSPIRETESEISSIEGPLPYVADTIKGYPIFEQRYLSIETDYDLWFGTVNCDVPFEDPVDYPDETISPDYTSYCSAADTWTNLDWHSPTTTVFPRYGHRTTPLRPIPFPRPYSLDIFCESKLMTVEEEDLGEPVYVPLSLSDEELEYINKTITALSASAPPDSSDTFTIWHREAANTVPFSMSVNVHPNPFNSEISIEITLPDNEFGEIEIYSLGGQMVRKLYSGELKAGVNHFKWDGKDNNGTPVSSGIYLVKTKASNGFSDSKEILLLK